MEKGKIQRFWTALALIPLLALLACNGTPDPAPPNGGDGPEVPPETGEGNPENGDAPAAFGFDLMGSGFEAIQDVLFLLGADRAPTYSMREIAATHDPKTWTYRADAPDGVQRTIEAVRDFREADYEGWDDSSMVIAVLSTMAVRDPSALVRAECVDTLSWFDKWVKQEAGRIGTAITTSDDDVIRALRALDALDKDPGETLDTPAKLVTIDAISILGSHPWDKARGPNPALIRTMLSRPRGVIRRLTARDLQPYRNDAEIRDSLDRALIRVADEVVFMTQVAVLADPVEHVRATGAKALLYSTDPRAVNHLAYALRGEQALTVRLAIVRSLEGLAGSYPATLRDAVPALGTALTGSEDSVRRAAARALASLIGDGPGDDPAYWQRWWRDHAEEYATP